MKAIIILTVALLVGGLSVASAGQKDAKAKSAKDSKAAQKVTLKTGSKIPRTVKLDGRITDGTYQVVVITSENIRLSGASTVSQVLMRNGAWR